jgi:outer membrane protein with glycine zipper
MKTQVRGVVAHITKPVALLALVGLVLGGCYGQPLSTREKGTLAGGAIGAGTGAIIGSAVGAPGAGAAIGGALGAGTGLMVGNELQNREVAETHLQGQISQQQGEIAQQRREIEQLRQQDE